jgi:glyoxylate reductase
MPIIAITRKLPPRAYELLAQRPEFRIRENTEDRCLTPNELERLAEGADALICTLADRVDADLLHSLAPQLRVVSQYAVGINNIDLKVAKQLGVRVANTPDVLTNATAELAITLMLTCARRILEGDRLMRSGGFTGWSPTLLLGNGLTGRTVGIVGTGRIGRRTAEMLVHGFGCRVLAWSRTPRESWAARHDVRYVSLNELLASVDIVSLHCALTPDTHHILDGPALDRLQTHAIVVNTSRGPIIDECALVERLKSKRLLAAGLDVFEHEPRLSDGLTQLPNVVLLPHVGSATQEARRAMAELCVNAAVRVLDGHDAPNLVV